MGGRKKIRHKLFNYIYFKRWEYHLLTSLGNQYLRNISHFVDFRDKFAALAGDCIRSIYE